MGSVSARESRDDALMRLDLMASGFGGSWALSDNDRAAIRMALCEIPPSHTSYVRVSREFVAELKAAPSQPVTIRIEERANNELHFVATRHDCPGASSLPHHAVRGEG